MATILANMVAADSCRHDVVDCGGIDICLELLNESPLDYKTPSEIAACERVQQKAAIALTRMCRDEINAATIVKSEGILYCILNFITSYFLVYTHVELGY